MRSQDGKLSGQEFFLITSGTARVWVKSGDDEQEYVWEPGRAYERNLCAEVRLHAGNLFGERALLKIEPRAASVTAVTEAEDEANITFERQ